MQTYQKAELKKNEQHALMSLSTILLRNSSDWHLFNTFVMFQLLEMHYGFLAATKLPCWSIKWIQLLL